MKETSTHYNDLISRYFYGESSPEEISELGHWVKADPANTKIFAEFHKSWLAYENSKSASSIDLDQEWNKLKSRIPQGSATIQPASRTNYLLTWSFRIAAAFLLLAIPAFFVYRYFVAPDNLELVARAGVMEQILPDGTTVSLNEGARLYYPSKFGQSERRVRLEGEAWFEVAHNRSSPFIVEAGDLRIKVVGTTFLVNTSSLRNSREVILTTGLVEVYHHDQTNPAVLLHPGERAESGPAAPGIRKSVNGDLNFLSWKTRRLVFNNTPLNEVVALLTRVYHKNVMLADPGLSNCRITVTFDRQTLESVLNVLAATLNLHVRETSTAYELSGSGCTPQ